MANVHLPHDLPQMQSLPLEAKIIMTKRRIRNWYEYWDGLVYVSFSGGKDSTVLKHLVDSMYDDVPALFVNTGLEYPEIQQFAKSQPNVVVVRPKMRFDEVIKKYGYPAVSKEVSQSIHEVRRAIKRDAPTHSRRMKRLNGELLDSQGRPSIYNQAKWKFLLDADFNVSHMCCHVMKKSPAKKYEKETGRKPIVGTLACESLARKQAWQVHGCNAFNSSRPISQPLSFWTEQDILHYIKKYNVPYCSVYGDIQVKPFAKDIFDGQINMFDYLGDYEPEDTLQTTGCDRTGCIFCMFGCHREGKPNRFQRLKETHPRQYQYCIGGGEYAEFQVLDRFGDEIKLKHCTREQIEKWISANLDNKNFVIKRKWQPSKEGLGLGHVLDYIGVKYE